jgi:hypothetical protein
MKATRRSVFVFLASAILFLVPSVSFADLIQDCMKSCSDQKSSDDKNCQGLGQGIDQGRAECLKNNLDIYNGCTQNCSPGAPSAETAPIKTIPQGTVPQTGTPQGTAPQNTAPQGSTLQRMPHSQGTTQP